MSPWSNLLDGFHFPNRPPSPSRQLKRPKNSLGLEPLEERVVMSATLFSDTFDSTEFDAANWSVVQNATIDDVGRDEPSAPYAARINGAAGTGDVLESVALDLSNESNVTLTYRFQRGGGGNVVEAGNDLVLQYRNAAGDWVEMDRKLGSGNHMQEFGHMTVALPTDALHANFQFRFMMTGGSTAIDTDDWFVDDVEIRSLDASEGELFTASQTQTNNLFFPNVLTFDFSDLPAPNGDATLTIRATGDLNFFLENLVLRADGQYVDQLFLVGGVDQAESTVTLILPQSFLETLAADGTISFTLTPSALVNNEGPTSTTLELSYSQVPVEIDTDPPVVESVDLSDDGRSFVIQMNDDDLDAIAAENVANYTILQANGDANGDGDPFNDGDETQVAIASVQYNAETDQIVVNALDQLYNDNFRLVIDGDGAAGDGAGGVTDLAGNHLANGDHFADFDRTVDVETDAPTIQDLQDATNQLNLSRRLQFRLSCTLNMALRLSEHGNGHTKAVTFLLTKYIRHLDWAEARGQISEADHAALVSQTHKVIDGLAENPPPKNDHQGHHHCLKRWTWSHHRWGRHRRC